MFDAAENTVRHQRTRGRAMVSLSAASGRARLRGLHQSGSAKVFLPRVHSPEPEVVFLNTAGGLTGGDRMQFEMSLYDGARAVATTQTAERAYASTGELAELEVDFSVGRGGHLDWLPQETILFQNAALSRRSTIALKGDASCLFVEMIVLGRAAMGEVLTHARLYDRREVTRDGVPLLIEPLRLADAALGRVTDPAGLSGMRAFATVALIGPGAEDALAPARQALGADGAVSAWDGKCVARLQAPDAYPLKRAVARLLNSLRGGAPLPRVWQV